MSRLSIPRIGVEVIDHPGAFVDVARRSRAFTANDGITPVPIDADGNPLSDGQVVIFDYRPIGSWDGPADDPAGFCPDMSGHYHLSFEGQAIVVTAGVPEMLIVGQNYDSSSNTTNAQIVLPSGTPPLMILRFIETRRSPDRETNTGIAKLRMIRPGYSPDTKEIFDKPFLAALRCFEPLRFMVWTNSAAAESDHLLTWKDRSLPSDAAQGLGARVRLGAHGISWEYIVALANETARGVWINIPVSASGREVEDDSSYVHQLAQLLHRGLQPDLPVYLEHANELWNKTSPECKRNWRAACQEGAERNSILNADGAPSPSIWAQRRHAIRLYEISRIFERVFGPGSLLTRIRPVYSWLHRHEHFEHVLSWMEQRFGPPRSYFYALAQDSYFLGAAAGPEATENEIIRAMRADSVRSVSETRRIAAVARKFGLRHTCYEGGPHNGGRSTSNIANRILANRSPAMGALLRHHLEANWFPHGPCGFQFFGLSNAYSRYGCFGLTEDYRCVDTEKFRAVESAPYAPAACE
jgi:hypothetical protein